MLVSPRLVKSLVVELGLGNRLEQREVRQFLYLLSLPGPGVALCVADVISSKPELTRSKFSPRLAYGIVDEGLSYFDIGLRQHQQLGLFRKLNLIRLGLQRRKSSESAIVDVYDNFGKLQGASDAVFELARAAQEFAGPELAVHLEQLAVAAMQQRELLLLLLTRIADQLSGEQRHRLLERCSAGFALGFNNQPWDDSKPQLILLDQPLQFRASLCREVHFRASAEELLGDLRLLCL